MSPNPSQTSWTVKEATEWAASFLHERMSVASNTYRLSPSAEQAAILRYEILTLLEHVTGWSRTKLLVETEGHLPKEVIADFRGKVEQRATGIPLQHILGEAWFYGRPFHIEPGCLIPRPETELLVESALTWMRKHNPKAVVADIGTGSGCIAITVALECPQTTVFAVDLSSDALAIARKNAGKLLGEESGSLTMEPAIRFHHGDGIEALRRPSTVWGDALNVLISNPPYIPSSDVDELDLEVRIHEPRLALDGGPDGLDIYRQFAELGSDIFADGPAALFFEVGMGQAQDVVRLFTEQHAERWIGWRFGVRKDLRGIERIVWGSNTDG